MDLNKRQVTMTKGIAILFMLLLHLFCTKQYEGLFEPLVMVGKTPLIYYFALFGDCCVAIYCFSSGFGLMKGYMTNPTTYMNRNGIRITKLYLNFWIILVLFVLLLGPLLGKSEQYPGNIKTFLLTFTGLSPAYNGAWWFFTTYILLVLSSPIINQLVMKSNKWILILVSVCFYCIAYVQRIKTPFIFDNEVINWLIRQISLYGTSQLPYLIGAMFAYYKIYSKIFNQVQNLKLKNLIGISVVGIMIIGHGFVQTLFIAPFTGIIFICVINLIDVPTKLENLLHYFGKHSTNLWLTHMFFYMIYFKELVYAPTYPILIFAWLLILCLGASYIINLINKPINKMFDQRLQNRKDIEFDKHLKLNR